MTATERNENKPVYGAGVCCIPFKCAKVESVGVHDLINQYRMANFNEHKIFVVTASFKHFVVLFRSKW